MESKVELLQVGVINSQKRQDVSIKVVRKLIDDGINTNLTIVGEGAEKENLILLAKKLGLSKFVKFTGFIEHKDIDVVYKDCDLVLSPGVNETFSAVPLEGLLNGRVSVISDDCGLIEILRDYAIFTKSSVENFYDAVLTYLKRRRFFIKKARLGEIWVKKNLSWDRYAKKFIDATKEEVPSTVYDKNYFQIHHVSPKSDYLFQERQMRIQRGVRLLEIKKGDKVLDLGCGNGEVAEIMVKKGAQVYGIDYSEDAIKLCRQRKLRSAIFKLGRVGRLPYPSKYFDAVISLDVFEHIYNDELDKALLEILRVVKPGGRLIVATAPNSFYLKPAEFMAKIFMSVKNFESNEYHINVFNYYRFSRLFHNLDADKTVFLTNDGHHYFYSRIVKNNKIPSVIKSIAKLVDFTFENPISEKIILNTPLAIFFAHDLWAVVRFNNED